MITTIRKKDGTPIDLESEEALTLDELMQLCGEHVDNPMVSAVMAMAEAVKSQPAPQVNVAPPASPAAEKTEWRSASVKITGWDNHGRIESMNIERHF